MGPTSSTSRRRKMGRWLAMISVMSASVVAGLGHTIRAEASYIIDVPLAHTHVLVDNVSDYPTARVTLLVQLADRGMATTNPLGNNVSGEMEYGDRVVVTHWGMYWLDVVRRGGQMSGSWALRVDGSGNANFKYIVGTGNWGPNYLLPGSNATIGSLYDQGQSILVLPQGGTDGSCTVGRGTFVLGNSGNCGKSESAAPVTMYSFIQGYDHLYQFVGTLYQEGTNHNTIMNDNYGGAASITVTLTYRFRDYTDPNYDYGTNNGPEQERVRTEVSLLPSGNIHLGTLVMAGNSDYASPQYQYRWVNYGNDARARGGGTGSTGNCPTQTYSGGSLGTICDGPVWPTNYVLVSKTWPTVMAQGDFVTERQNYTKYDANDRETTNLIPYSSTFTAPQSIDHIWNQGLGVSSFDMDWFNSNNVYRPGNVYFQIGFDTQMEPHP